MTVIEIFRAKNKEFCFRLMGNNYEEIWRASETYKRKATMKKSIGVYGGGWLVVDLTLLTKPVKKRTATKKK